MLVPSCCRAATTLYLDLARSTRGCSHGRVAKCAVFTGILSLSNRLFDADSASAWTCLTPTGSCPHVTGGLRVIIFTTVPSDHLCACSNANMWSCDCSCSRTLAKACRLCCSKACTQSCSGSSSHMRLASLMNLCLMCTPSMCWLSSMSSWRPTGGDRLWGKTPKHAWHAVHVTLSH